MTTELIVDTTALVVAMSTVSLILVLDPILKEVRKIRKLLEAKLK